MANGNRWLHAALEAPTNLSPDVRIACHAVLAMICQMSLDDVLALQHAKLGVEGGELTPKTNVLIDSARLMKFLPGAGVAIRVP